MKFVIDGEEPEKEEICKVRLEAGYSKNEVRIMVTNSQKTFVLATLRNGRIHLEKYFNKFDGIECNAYSDPLVETSDGDIING